MSNIQDYITTCIETADQKAQDLRDLAGVIGGEVKFAQSAGSKTILRLTDGAIRRKATQMQNLVRDMAEQLEAERAEFNRMERLYKMARMDIQDLKTQ